MTPNDNMIQMVHFEDIKLLRFIYYQYICIHINPLTQQMNVTLIICSIQWYHPSIIAYRLTCTMINYLYQRPNFLGDWMIPPVTVSTVCPFTLTITWIMLNIYSSIQVLLCQLLINLLHPHIPSITVTPPFQNTKYSVFRIHPTVLWRKDGTYYRYIYNLHSILIQFSQIMVNNISCYFQIIHTINITATNLLEGGSIVIV